MALRVKLGAELIRDCRQRSPAALVCVIPLLQHLFEHGLTSGVLQEVKCRHALGKALAKDPSSRLGTWQQDKAITSALLHILACASMCRAYKKEDDTGSSSRRFPKSGGFRRKMSAQDFQLISTCCSLLLAPDDALSVGAMSVSEFSDGMSAEDWPSCFGPTSTSLPASHNSGDHDNDDDDDDDAWPGCFAKPRCDPPIEPITPNVIRKRQQRQQQVTPTKNEKPKKPSPAKAKRSPAINPLYCRPIQSCYLAVTTVAPIRAEITGKVCCGAGEMKRIHVATTKPQTHGKEFANTAEELKAMVLKNHMTKLEASAAEKSQRI